MRFGTRSRLAGVLLHISFLRTVREGLVRTRASRPRAAQLSLCTPEHLVSRDSSDSTLSVLYRSYPHEELQPDSSERVIDPVHAIDPMPYRPPTSSRSSAMPAVIPSAEYESEVTIVMSESD